MSKNKLIILVSVLLVLGAGFYFLTGSKSLQDFTPPDFFPAPLHIGGLGNNAQLISANVIIQTNMQRQQNGPLLTLVENVKLTAAAKAKADDMFAKQYFEHVSPSGVDPGELVVSHGYDYIVTGENLILGNFKDEKEVVQLWMDSPGHRANMLNSRFTEIGVAMVKGKYKGQTAWIGVQEFGLPLSTCAQPDEKFKQQIQINKDTLAAEALQIDAKRQEINNANPRSAEYNQKVDEYNAMVANYNTLNEAAKQLIAEYNAKVNKFNACVAGK